MKSLLKNLIVASGVLLGCQQALAEQRVLAPGSLHVEDGDTLLIELDGVEQRLQLIGIDAPEDSDNPKLQRDMARTGLEAQALLELGVQATEYLRRLTRLGKPYTLYYAPGQRDRYGRLVGDLRDVRGRSLAEMVVAGGYAIAVANVAPEQAQRLQVLQQSAQQAPHGLWVTAPEQMRAWAAPAAPKP
jgi:micrococcal nuclease